MKYDSFLGLVLPILDAKSSLTSIALMRAANDALLDRKRKMLKPAPALLAFPAAVYNWIAIERQRMNSQTFYGLLHRAAFDGFVNRVKTRAGHRVYRISEKGEVYLGKVNIGVAQGPVSNMSWAGDDTSTIGP